MSKTLRDLSPDELGDLIDEQSSLYDELQAQGLKLDITRGKPSAAQLDLSGPLLTQPVGHKSADGTDVRNYGGLNGLPELRAIFAELLNINPELLVAGDSSSLAMMHDSLVFAMLYGVPLDDGTMSEPWFGQKIKFLCPVPGYDRHFSICAGLGIEMIPVEMGEHGPDVAQVRRLAADPTVKGMWVVPMYSNPGGAVYDEATTRALLDMPAAPDFRIFWDNAYALHHLGNDEPTSLNVIGLAEQAGNPNRVLTFASTSKITHAGDGVAFFGASAANLTWYLGHLGRRQIGPDKVNQLRHAQFLRNADGVRSLMRRHRELLAPKFRIVLDSLQRRLGGYGVATWTHPSGGYFVTLDVMDGTASEVVRLAGEAGIALTPAGASHPLGHDPHDRTIRIAPSFPTQGELSAAMDGLATCVLLAAARKTQHEREKSQTPAADHG